MAESRAKALESLLVSSWSAPLSPPSEALTVEIGGVPIGIRGSAGVMRFAREFLETYRTPSNAVVEVRIEERGSADLWEDECADFRGSGEWVLHRDFAARRRGSVFEAVCGPETADSIQNLLRWVMPSLLLERGAFLIHGTGVVRDGLGYVFFGPSGSGKSTVASLIAGCDAPAQVLGDDSVIVGLGDGWPTLWSAPLGCGYSRAAPPSVWAPLTGIYRLRQAQRTEILPLTRATGASVLLGSALWLEDDAADGSQRISLAEALASVGPGVSELRFRRDAEFWAMIRRLPSRVVFAIQGEESRDVGV